MNKLTLYTAAGGMDIIYLNELGPRIARHCVDKGIVDVMEPTNTTFANPHEMHRIADETFKKTQYILPTFLEISHVELAMIERRMDIGEYIRQKVFEAANKAIVKEIKIMAAQKQPTFFIKDLNMEALDNLSLKHVENFGGDAVGIEVRLSQYQKFFVIMSEEDFKFYYHEVQDVTKASHEFRGKLICFRPDRWVMGRYENLEYLKELSAKTMYQVPINKGEEK